ncbi:hypothetical protein L915_00383 [Phytophthora nicotianae]|uniref:RxLR effector protein n=1 Tax=Phytophthora nicotianae TaxID=4792 RepID=W2HP25_PHYNI|nr:hypothetical protein L915_00383 [Phytophthora nicotianae]
MLQSWQTAELCCVQDQLFPFSFLNFLCAPQVLWLAALSTVTGAHALSTIGAVQDTEATGMTTTDLDLIAESHSSANVKRFLRSQSDVEERLQGNNMFNLEKFKRASDDANYAKSLFPEVKALWIWGN